MATADRIGVFRGFGDSVFPACVRRPIVQIGLNSDRVACRRLVRERAPASPGVYGWIDRNQRLLYVGKSRSLRHRLLSYFAKTDDDPKVRRLRQQSSRIVWEPLSHDLLAILREQELIFRWRPSFNRQGQPERRKPGFVGISGGAAPRIVLAHGSAGAGGLRWGPVVGMGDLRVAVESLNYVFGLRDCSDRVRMNLSGQLPLFGDLPHAQCIRHELQTCLGPCCGGCSSHAYRQAVERAAAFLRGDDLSILEQLKINVEALVARLAFERAAVVHQQWKSLDWLAKRLDQRHRQSQELTGRFPIPAFGERHCHLVLDGGYFIGVEVSRRGRPKSNCIRSDKGTPDGLAIEWMLLTCQWFRRNAGQSDGIQRTADSTRALRISA